MAAEPDRRSWLAGRLAGAVAADQTAAITGTILVAAVIASLGHRQTASWAVVASVLATAGAYWAAHVWARAMAVRLRDPTGFDWRQLATIARHEWPLVTSATLPVLALLLAAVGAYSDRTGIDVALAVAVAELFGWGLLVGLRALGAWPLALVSAAVNGAIGVALVVLKALIH